MNTTVMDNQMVRIVISFVGGFVLGVVAIWVWDATVVDDSLQQMPELDGVSETTSTEESGVIGLPSPANGTATSTPENGAIAETGVILVADQKAGSPVMVRSVTLESDGWIVVHEERSGVVGNALGAVRRDAGAYIDVRIPLLRPTAEGARYFVVLYRDNGDRMFNLADDFPIRDENDEPLFTSFIAE
ncbi:MAG: hypothetical protein Q8P16_01335 [bacterium]|nr:hypothetical protein [bacterium]